jgi:hypothetical protein
MFVSAGVIALKCNCIRLIVRIAMEVNVLFLTRTKFPLNHVNKYKNIWGSKINPTLANILVFSNNPVNACSL